MSLLSNLPSRGYLVCLEKNHVVQSGHIPRYVATNNTAPVQVIKTDTTNILIRSLMQKKKKAQMEEKDISESKANNTKTTSTTTTSNTTTTSTSSHSTHQTNGTEIHTNSNTNAETGTSKKEANKRQADTTNDSQHKRSRTDSSSSASDRRPTPPNSSALQKMTKNQLVDLLKLHGLPHSGNKDKLIGRLVQYQAQQVIDARGVSVYLDR